MSYIIGIDLGTSTSEAAIFKNGTPVLIPNEMGEHIIPSVIGMEHGNFMVGQEAANRQLLYPESTAIEVKRKIGSTDTISLDGTPYSPILLSSLILSYIKSYAEHYLGEEINEAVITVPAYFNNEQRTATLEAGKLAGFQVKRIINEPTAAALCYGINHMEEENHILVYDFGGGTFDVTLLELFNGVLDVKASSGDNQLGGKDFDQAIIDYLLSCCMSKYQIDLTEHLYAMVKLKEAATKCKIALSSQPSYEIILPMIAEKDGSPISLQETITVELFESLIAPLVERTKSPIELVLNDSGLTKEDIDIILLVGGSTKIPYIRSYVKDLLGQDPKELIDPDLSVALGAAIQGGILNHDISSEDGIMLTDVAPYSLGMRVSIEQVGSPFYDFMDILVPRNTTIPMSKTKQYSTTIDDQPYAMIEIYQGESELASKNLYLGEFQIGPIPLAKAGQEKVDVTFSYDLNGILVVSAKIVSTGANASITVDMSNLSEQDSSPDIDITTWDRTPRANKYRSTIEKAEKYIRDFSTIASALSIPGLVEELEEALLELKEALVEQADDSILDGLEFIVTRLMDELDME